LKPKKKKASVIKLDDLIKEYSQHQEQAELREVEEKHRREEEEEHMRVAAQLASDANNGQEDLE